MEIMVYPNPKLSSPLKLAELNDHTLCIIDEMISTMYRLKALGLAANQIGEDMAVFVMDMDGKPFIAINPTVHGLGETIEMEEACLSLPGISAKIPRSKYANIIYTTIGREVRSELFEGIQARAIQHELDHLNGKLYWNNLSTLKRDLLKKRYKKIHKHN